jgi:uncharacterized protein (DUF1697 family)
METIKPENRRSSAQTAEGRSVRYCALLRGINVGGSNVIKMAELKALFESAGFTAVTTYIQSGNILFLSNAGKEEAAGKIETLLHRRLGSKIPCALRTPHEMQAVIDSKPAGFGDNTETYRGSCKTSVFNCHHTREVFWKPLGGQNTGLLRNCNEFCNRLYKYDVGFLIDPLTGADAVQKIKTREGVDVVYAGDTVVYISRLISGITKSYLSKITESPIYQSITIRNWNTTKKLCGLMAGAGA